MANPLDAIVTWYTSAKDGMWVARRVIEKAIPDAITEQHSFHSKLQPESAAALDQALEELNRLVVLALAPPSSGPFGTISLDFR